MKTQAFFAKSRQLWYDTAREKRGFDVKKRIAWLLCVAWMGVIYAMSAMTGEVSGGQSGRIVNALLVLMEWTLGSDAAQAVSPDLLSVIVRKGAHMTEYAVLFLLYRRALMLSGAKHPGRTARQPDRSAGFQEDQ